MDTTEPHEPVHFSGDISLGCSDFTKTKQRELFFFFSGRDNRLKVGMALQRKLTRENQFVVIILAQQCFHQFLGARPHLQSIPGYAVVCFASGEVYHAARDKRFTTIDDQSGRQCL